MKTLKFECRLLSDVIINQKSATEGENATLDFIPGNVFLGIVASHYGELGDKALEIFHSGRVRFGDAHPVSESLSNIRTLRVPAVMFYPKLKGLSGGCYISYYYHRENDYKNGVVPPQLKQCRNGFYAFGQGEGVPAMIKKSFSLKSAYDSNSRRACDNMMFGYEALDAGARFLFEVQVEDDSLAGIISDMLLGIHYVGKSRTAQYGQVKISRCNYDDISSTQQLFTQSDGCQYATVYADSRLIFIDAECEPTFMPSAADLGIEHGKIDWSLSQVRTFSYAPWNGKRSTRDAERCGIEKGSVFVVRIDEPQTFVSQYVGAFLNEGFGKVIYNPDFLSSDGNNGKACFRLLMMDEQQTTEKNTFNLGGTPLLDFLKRKKNEMDEDSRIYKAVNRFVEENSKIFLDEQFASQWGTIRSIAMKERTYERIVYMLFDKTKIVNRTLNNQESVEPNAYLTHGVAVDRWTKKGRRETLRRFIEDMHASQEVSQFGDITAKALVNLASEMSKQLNNGDDGK